MTTTTDPKIEALMGSLTEQVIASIEEGIANPKGWAAPWHSILAGAVNATTKRKYNGGNALFLGFMGEGPWATFKQWQTVGATVRKGEKGTMILVPAPVKFTKTDAKTGEDKTVRFVRYRTAYVFNAGQVDGWTAPEGPVNPEPRIADAEAWLAAWSAVVPVSHAPNRAYYTPSQDTITLPAFDHFKSAEGYYSTAMHEAGHSTGHPDRLNRNMGEGFGTPSYAREELVAELTAAFLGNHFGIATGMADHNRDYLANWLQALKNDTSLLWDAAADAQKAVALLLSVVPDSE